ncbi:MAG: hypothetical protein A2Y93_05745 [Chloroflexi bacterium RBG_13_68_17]|nr:MAG: hypothetical protein A2Y93_05745 [Chloroflexi bacterium RBG_13_68_17]
MSKPSTLNDSMGAAQGTLVRRRGPTVTGTASEAEPQGIGKANSIVTVSTSRATRSGVRKAVMISRALGASRNRRGKSMPVAR